MILALIGVSMPTFWFGLLSIRFFAVETPIFPVTGRGTFAHLVLPAITLGLSSTGIIARMTRSALLEVLGQDYVRTARAKGGTPRMIVLSTPCVTWCPCSWAASSSVVGAPSSPDGPTGRVGACSSPPCSRATAGRAGLSASHRRVVHRGEPTGGPHLRPHRPRIRYDRPDGPSGLPAAAPEAPVGVAAGPQPPRHRHQHHGSFWWCCSPRSSRPTAQTQDLRTTYLPPGTGGGPAGPGAAGIWSIAQRSPRAAWSERQRGLPVAVRARTGVKSRRPP